MEERVDIPLGYDVVDAAGRRLGPVEGVWGDRRAGRIDFFSVGDGLLVPAPLAHFDKGAREARLDRRAEDLFAAPLVDAGVPLEPELEKRVREHYGIGGAGIAQAAMVRGVEPFSREDMGGLGRR